MTGACHSTAAMARDREMLVQLPLGTDPCSAAVSFRWQRPCMLSKSAFAAQAEEDGSHTSHTGLSEC